MLRTTSKCILFMFAITTNPSQANEAVFNDINKVKECWLTCPDEAKVAGERALKFLNAQEPLEQDLVDAYAKLVKYYTRVFLDKGDYKRAEEIVNGFLSLSRQPTSEEDFAFVLTNLGVVYYGSNRIILAEKTYKEALALFRKVGNKGAEGSMLNNLGNVNLEKSRVAQAIDYYQQSLAIAEKHSSNERISTVLNNLGIQLSIKGQFELAEQYILRAKDLIEDSPNIRKKIQVIQAYGWYFIYAKRYEEALEYLLENESFIQESNVISLQSHFFFQLGTVWEALGKFAEAEVAFQKSLDLALQLNAFIVTESSSMGLAKLASKRGEIEEAKVMLKELYANAVAEERFEFAGNVQLELIKTLSENKQFEAAYLELNAHLESYQARVEEEQESDLSQYFALLETEEEKRKVAELELQNAQKELELSLSESNRQKNLTIFVVAALFLLSIGGWLAQRRKIALLKAKSTQEVLDKKNELLSDISHELRTPLTAIKLQVETLEYELSTKPEQTYALVYDKIASLNRLIDDVFQLSKASSKELDLYLKPTNAKQFILELAEKFESQLTDKQITFSIVNEASEQTLINIDQKRIEQVFINLVSNTARYTDIPGTCRLTMSNSKNTFNLVFEDSAPGVSESGLKRLFERLYREDSSRSRAHGGSGLGLSIVHAFIEAHHGNIVASHSELGGVRFDISLPIYSAQN